MANFDEKSRVQLLDEARTLGIERPERMTRVELRDAIIQRTVPKDKQAEARGLFGVARSMLASVVETGLHLPDAAKVIRGDHSYEIPVENQSPVATVTLAEIYSAQGHKARARSVLDDVLREEPDHEEALRVWGELFGARAPQPKSEAPKSKDEGSIIPAARITEPPPSGETTDYVPGGFVETTGEAVESEEPPPVAVRMKVEQDEPAAVRVSTTKDAPEASAQSSQSREALEVALIVIQGAESLSLYWELPKTAVEGCGVDLAEGEASLKVVAFVPSGTTPERSERSIPLANGRELQTSDGLERGAGLLSLNDLPRNATIRAAVGWDLGDAFLPLAVGRSLEQCGGDKSASALLRRVQQALA